MIRAFLKFLAEQPELMELKCIKLLSESVQALEPIQVALRWFFYQAAPIRNEDSYAQQIEKIRLATYQVLNDSCFNNNLHILVKSKEYPN